MSFTPRAFEDIVRDQLTTLTGGTTGESLVVPPGDVLLMPQKLSSRPVRRISHLDGTITVGAGPAAKQVPYRFTAADFELVSASGDPNNLDSIRFRPKGRRPTPATTLTVNYYPIQTNPVPLTDLNVGSVVRTLMETVSRELALAYLGLDAIYRSAFIDTATSDALDQVVALVGVKRLPAGAPVTPVRFSRRDGTAGQVNIPSGTVLTDKTGSRYLTLADITMEAGETTRDVLAGGEPSATKDVAAGTLNQLETLIAGVAKVTNPQASHRLSVPETDDDLRRRSRGALRSVSRGTVDALRFGILSVPGVKDVVLREFPNGVPGEIGIDIAYADANPDTRSAVAQRIEELRPAGIRVLAPVEASGLRIAVRVELTLVGASLASADLAALTASMEDKLNAFLTAVPPGGSVRRAKLTQIALADPRVADARVVLTPNGQADVEDLTLDTGVVLTVARPFAFPPPKFEQAGAAVAVTGSVSGTLPIHLVAGTTATDATSAINLAFAAHLATRRTDQPLTFDGLAAAIADDTRFALVRQDSLLTVESGGRFLQLTDQAGSYAPAANETLRAGTVDVQIRDGGV